MKPGGHEQRKSNNHVYSFLLFVSSVPRYQVEFKYFERSLLYLVQCSRGKFKFFFEKLMGCNIPDGFWDGIPHDRAPISYNIINTFIIYN